MTRTPTLTADASLQALQSAQALRTVIAAQDASGDLLRSLSAAVAGLLKQAYGNDADAQERYLAAAADHDDMHRRQRAWAAAEQRNRQLPQVW